jgi:hypothetical protein
VITINEQIYEATNEGTVWLVKWFSTPNSKVPERTGALPGSTLEAEIWATSAGWVEKDAVEAVIKRDWS